MANWYCILQGRDIELDFWKQIYKTFVIAENKKEAIKNFYETIDVDNIPLRILRKDINKFSLLLHVYEIKSGHFTETFIEERICSICGKAYRLIDKFNEFGTYSTYECCSLECDDIDSSNKIDNYNLSDNFYSSYPVIYKIKNIKTNKCYIGQTIRSFTLRWWEHIKTLSSEDKFHKELKSTNIIDWEFGVIEVFDKNIPKELLTEKEKYWINYYNSKENSYNSL